MELEYEKVGDYYFPKMLMKEQPEESLTKYGLMRKTYLQEHKPVVYEVMIMAGKLKTHCLEVQKAADERMEVLVSQMAKKENVNEKLKANNQMLWVQMMNNITHSAEEIVLKEIVYN